MVVPGIVVCCCLSIFNATINVTIDGISVLDGYKNNGEKKSYKDLLIRSMHGPNQLGLYFSMLTV